MEIKYAYQLDEQGYFVGLVPRQKSPLEQDVWFVPAGATIVEPPTIPEGKRAKFDAETQTFSLEDIPVVEPVEGPTGEPNTELSPFSLDTESEVKTKKRSKK